MARRRASMPSDNRQIGRYRPAQIGPGDKHQRKFGGNDAAMAQKDHEQHNRKARRGQKGKACRKHQGKSRSSAQIGQHIDDRFRTAYRFGGPPHKLKRK